MKPEISPLLWRQQPVALHEAATAEKLASELAAAVADRLAAAVATRGRADLVVSGGSTPLPFFTALASLSLPWSNVSVWLADERWVEPAHADSNEGLVRRALMCDAAATATLHGMYLPESSAAAAAAAYGERLQQRGDAFDVVILGMGGDAHTASLFPDSPELPQALTPANAADCIAVTTPSSPWTRLTLTLPCLLATEHLYLHITGAGKRQVLADALAGGSRTATPVRNLFDHAGPQPVLWWAA